MHRRFLPSGRVRYFPLSDYVGEHRFVSRLTGESSSVRVRRKLVDTTYVEGAIPAQIVDQDERTVAFMDISPATRGHALRTRCFQAVSFSAAERSFAIMRSACANAGT